MALGTSSRDTPSIWFHALGAKVGGGLTYLDAVLPELLRQLDGRGIRLVLLLPAPLDGVALPAWCDVRVMPSAAHNGLARVVFDQVVLPWKLWREHGAVLFCSGSFSPLVKAAPTVVLIRNAIYFDLDFLRRERLRRRLLLKLQGALIRTAARGCRAIHYPSRYMRALVEHDVPALTAGGRVNYYGVKEAMVKARAEPAGERSHFDARVRPATFLYVMNYTAQKNLSFLLEALVVARTAGLNVRVVVTSWLASGPRSCFVADNALIEAYDLVRSGYLVPVGPKYGDELVQLYRETDACVFPSICESFGHPLVEALAAGKPIICADRPYAREICGDDAFYVNLDQPGQLVNLWRRWPILNGYSPRPLDEFVETFSWQRHVTRLLESLLAEARA